MDSLVDRNPQGLFESKYFAMRYALCVGAIHVVLLVWGSFAHGPGWDEVGHLAAGWSHWKTSRTDLYRVNPPLVRMLATVPLLGKDPKIEFDRNSQYNLGRPEFDDGADLIFKHGNGYLTLLRMARLACLIFAISALWIIWTWSYEMFGASGAMLSVTIWAFSPMVLNNAHLITPDVGAAAVGTCACYTFFWWLKRGTLRLAFLSGLLLGTALLTKFTWLLLAGLWPVQWFGQRMFGPLPCGNKGYRKPTFGQAALLVAVSWFVFNLGYGFEGSFERLDRYSFYSSALSGNERPNEGDPILGNRFAGKFLGAMPVPLPRNVLLGVDRQKVDFESKMPSYLRGEWRTHGWWYYYLYATVVKEPLPFLALGILAVMAGVLLVKWTRAGICDAIHLLMPGMALFAFVSSQTGFNHHLRYVLPAFPFFAIGIGVLGSQEVRQFRWLYRLSFGLAILGSLASVSISPHWHAFFNVTVGGPQNGPFHLLDSNVDWGQDVLLFKRWVQSHPELPLDGVEYALPAWLGVRSLAGIDSGFVPKGYDQTQKKPDSSGGNSDTGPSPGRYALSVIPIYREDSGYDYFQRIEPIARVGWTIRVYELTQSDTDQIRDSLGYEPLKRDQILK